MSDIDAMDIRKVDLNLLVVFDALLRELSVSRAAEALGMSQPAMSFALGKLRVMFDDPLFIRASRGVRPTPRAEQLAAPLQSVLDQIKSAVLQPPAFDPSTTRRTFTFRMADVGELVFLPKIRAHLARVAPEANIRILATPPAQIEEALESGELDLAVGYFPTLQGAAIYQQRLFSHSLVCVVRKDHPVIGDQITRAQFMQAQHVVVHRENVSHELFEQALAEQGLSRRIVVSVPHFLAIPLLIAESDMVATVPYAVGLSFARMAELKVLRPPTRVPPVDVKQFWHARFHRDQANTWIRGVIAELFAETRQGARRKAVAAPASSSAR